MNRSVDEAIQDAVEASYYLSPERPGLRYAELLVVLAKVGLAQGEIDAALGRLTHEALLGGASGYVFGERPPLWLVSDGSTHRFKDDPRDRATASYLQELLRERARTGGLQKPLAQLSELVARGRDDGHDEHQIRLCLRWLGWCDIVKIDDASGVVTATHNTLRWGNIATNVSPHISSREGFAEILAAVRDAIAERSPKVRWERLLAQLPSPQLKLSGDEQQVLTDALAFFADRGEGRSFDDARRQMKALEVQTIAHALVDPKGLLHARSNATVVPSLLAIASAPTLFGPLLVLLDDVLHRAEQLWDEKQTRPALKGAQGLLDLSKEARAPECDKTLRQFELLLEVQSLSPCLYMGSSVVEIRDDIASLNTIVKLLKHKCERQAVERGRSATMGPFAESAQGPALKRSASAEKSIALLRNAAAEAKRLEGNEAATDAEFERWHENTRTYLRRIFGADSIQSRRFDGVSYHSEYGPGEEWYARCEGLEVAGSILRAFVHELEVFHDEAPDARPHMSALDEVVHLLGRFSAAAHSLRTRRKGRDPLLIENEYDVQYLLHALLLTRFEDVRPEDPTPNHAGASGRMDFLLKSERIMIEVKMTRDSLMDKELGEELIVDVHRYAARMDCDALICFVYDPGSRLRNAAGIKADMERSPGRLAVRVVVAT